MIALINPVFIKNIPPQHRMKIGVLYISKEYSSASHLCPCGCGNLVVTPLNHESYRDGWELREELGNKITLEPSMSNPFKCKTHYWIKANRIVQAS